MSFFDSEIVRAEMAEIHELQEDVYENFMKFPYMNNADRARHIDQLSKLIEKQKIVYARLSLSDDPDAKEMKEKICLLYTSPSPRDKHRSRMPSSA